MIAVAYSKMHGRLSSIPYGYRMYMYIPWHQAMRKLYHDFCQLLFGSRRSFPVLIVTDWWMSKFSPSWRMARALEWHILKTSLLLSFDNKWLMHAMWRMHHRLSLSHRGISSSFHLRKIRLRRFLRFGRRNSFSPPQGKNVEMPAIPSIHIMVRVKVLSKLDMSSQRKLSNQRSEVLIIRNCWL